MKRDNNPNAKGFPMFLLSLIPGAAHMYMGLMKRGIQILMCFAVCIGIMSLGSLEFILLPLSFIIFVYSFFDGYSCRRQIRTGTYVEDESIFDEMLAIGDGRKINKKWLGIALVILSVAIVLSTLTNRYYFVYEMTRIADFALDTLPALLLFALGIVLITRSKKDKQNSDGDGIIAIEENNDK